MFSKLTRAFACDIDLTRFSCKRVRFERLSDNTFNVISDLRMPRACMSGFIERLIKRRAGQYKSYSGNASKPAGYFYND